MFYQIYIGDNRYINEDDTSLQAKEEIVKQIIKKFFNEFSVITNVNYYLDVKRENKIFQIIVKDKQQKKQILKIYKELQKALNSEVLLTYSKRGAILI